MSFKNEQGDRGLNQPIILQKPKIISSFVPEDYNIFLTKIVNSLPQSDLKDEKNDTSPRIHD